MLFVFAVSALWVGEGMLATGVVLWVATDIGMPPSTSITTSSENKRGIILIKKCIYFQKNLSS